MRKKSLSQEKVKVGDKFIREGPQSCKIEERALDKLTDIEGYKSKDKYSSNQYSSGKEKRVSDLMKA
jgi:hypothetical protein